MPKKVDANQKEIVAGLRKAGYSVQHLHELGKGCPDILVGAGGKNVLMEIKRDKASLTPDEVEWHEHWRGQVAVVRSTDDALKVMRQIREQDYPEHKPFHECEGC